MLPDYLGRSPLRRSEPAAEQVGCQDHAEADDAGYQQGTLVGDDEHGDEHRHHGGYRQVRQRWVEPHPQLERLWSLALQAAAHHELRDGDQEVGEERDRPRGVDQPREDVRREEVVDRDGHVPEAGPGEDRPDRYAAGRRVGEEPRRVVVPGKGEEHPRGGVQAGVEDGEHSGQDDEVHHVGRKGYAHSLERDGERALDDYFGERGVPRHYGGNEEDRDHVEEQDPIDDRVGRTGHISARLIGLRRRDGDDLRPDEREDHGDDAAEHHQTAVGKEAALIVEVREPHAPTSPGPQADHEQRPEDDKDDDRSDLYACEPELELAVGADGVEVGGGECQDQDQGYQRGVYPRYVLSDYARRNGGLEPDHDGPEVPVEPPYGESGPVAQSHPAVVREGTDRRLRHCHLAEHPHDQDQDAPRQKVAEDGRWTCLVEDRARPHEQPSPDDPAQGDHGHVPPLQALLQMALLPSLLSPFHTRFGHVVSPSLKSLPCAQLTG